MKNKRVSIYVRNQYLTPSSYYRIAQYVSKLEGEIKINNIAPTEMYRKNQQLDKSKKILYVLKSIHYYIVMLFRATYFILKDCINKPDYIIVSKVILPKYMPYFTYKLLDYLTKKTTLYWDFDDLLFETSNDMTKQHFILGENSKNIIVTSGYLKDTLLEHWKSKCILLATTDGDLQGFDFNELMKTRKIKFDKEIRLVWVATSGNLVHLINIISELDKAALEINKKLNKRLILSVVCDKPLNVNVESLIIRNITWNREIAKKEIYDAHIGIMPLIYNNFTLGKGGFKLIQYISTGLPTIASDVGFNNQVVDDECGILVKDRLSTKDWYEAIIKMSLNWKEIENRSKKSYEKWNYKFSYKNNVELWNDLLKS